MGVMWLLGRELGGLGHKGVKRAIDWFSVEYVNPDCFEHHLFPSLPPTPMP